MKDEKIKIEKVESSPLNEGVLIFPTQLFRHHPCLKRGRRVFIVQDQLFWKDWKYPCSFSKQKLLLHLASCLEYQKNLSSRGYETAIVSYQKGASAYRDLFENINEKGILKLFLADPADYLLEKRLRDASEQTGLSLEILESPAFLCLRGEEEQLPLRGKQLSMTSFYINQRKRFHILVDEKERPKGGKWSHDPSNRQKLPQEIEVPSLPCFSYSPDLKDLAAEIEKNHPHNPGNCKNLIYPVTGDHAREMLDDFLNNRLCHFGDYEDAMSPQHPFLFHSVISSSLNIGLLTPSEVLEDTMKYVAEKDIPVNNIEGFIRQICGWREFMRLVYRKRGNIMRTSNFWRHERAIPESFINGETGIIPIDICLKKVEQYSYAHHIERLMLLGNFLLLCEVHPDEVYGWFMSRFIDAFDWVMVPNVYGMSQYSDGGGMVTKPYLCSSGYLLRMGRYQKGDWCQILDSLFWRFIHVHRDEFSINPRQKIMLKNLERMDRSKLNRHLKQAGSYLENLK